MPAMVAAAKPASVVNMASVAAVGMSTLHAPYMASKHAVLSFSESLFLEVKEAAPMITVSVVLPGPVATRIYEDAVCEENKDVRDGLRNFLAAGMPADEAAKAILEQVAAQRFWISPHPEMLTSWARGRAAYLAALTDPDAKAAVQD
jgi:short-subunit dehydrogenase